MYYESRDEAFLIGKYNIYIFIIHQRNKPKLRRTSSPFKDRQMVHICIIFKNCANNSQLSKQRWKLLRYGRFPGPYPLNRVKVHKKLQSFYFYRIRTIISVFKILCC